VSVVDAIVQAQVVAIVRDRGADAEQLVANAAAVLDAGSPVVEVTLDSPGALDAIRVLAGRDDALVGAGTVLRPDDVDAVAAVGGRFVVAPDVSPVVIGRARALGLATLPGAYTPTEVRAATDAGADLVKLFPATGGTAHLRALRGPFGDVGFVPTGGIALDDVAELLAAGAVAVGLGSALVGGDPDVTAERVRGLRRRLEHVGAG
jgi:2-dehydro-3-deoxyphosphogluconate aldolase / (4S)-4-hydroxy-2-oxoglutarate aldolase